MNATAGSSQLMTVPNMSCLRGTGRVAACLVVLAITGCGPAENQAQSQPTVDRQENSSQPLDEKALLTLDELDPRVEPPQDAEDIPEPQPRAKEALQEARELLEQQDNFAAVRLLERAVGFDPDHPEIRRMLGLAYARQRNWNKALENFRTAAEVAPDDLTLQVWLGLLAMGQNRDEDAIVAFRRALKCSDADPSKPPAAEALLRLGQVLHRQDYYTASLECYERLSEWIQDHGSVYADRPALRNVVLRPERLLTPKGELLLELGRAEDAADVLNRAFRMDRSHRETVRLLLTALLQSDQSEQAVEVLVDIASEPAHEEHFVELAEKTCRTIEDPELPLRLWRQCRRRGRSHGDLAVALSRVAADLGAADEAAVLLSEALETMPDNVDAAREMVRLKSDAGDVAGAMALLVNIIAADAAATDVAGEAIAEVGREQLDEELARKLSDRSADETDNRRHAAHYVAGMVAERAGLEYLAAEQYRAALNARSGFGGAAEALLDIYLRQGRFDRADELVEGFAGDEEFFRRYLSGKLALARGKAESAVEWLRRAYELDNTHLPTISLLARAHRGVGQSAQASRILRRAITLAPQKVEYYRRLFDVQAVLGRHTEAEDVVDVLRRRTGDELTADVMTAELHLAKGDYDKARELLADIKQRAPDRPEVELLEIRAAVETGEGELDEEDFTRAIRVLSREVERVGGESMAMRLLMQLVQQRDRPQEAVAVWENLYRKTHDRLAARLYVSALAETEQHAQAITVLEEVLSGDQSAYWARREMLDLLHEQGRTDRAVDFANEWLEQTSHETVRQMLYRSLVGIHSEAEDYAAAQDVLDAWLDEARDADTRHALRMEKIRLYGEAGEYDRAVEFVREASESVSDDLRLKLSLLLLLKENEQYEKALELVLEWLEDAEGNDRDILTHFRIDLHSMLEQFDAAESVAAEWIERSPDDVRPRMVIVFALSEAEQYDRALRLIDEWIQQRETTTAPAQSETETPTGAEDEILQWCRLVSVRLLMMQDRNADALERLDSHEWYAQSAEAMNIRATCLEQLGRRDEALAALENARELDPDDASINNNLGYFYAEEGVNLDKAERLIRRALMDLPDEVAFMDSLGWVFYKQGRFQAAVRVLERALGIGEDAADGAADGGDRQELETHAVILDHLGDVYWRLGRAEDALEMWRKALAAADREESPAADTREVLSETPLKIDAVEEDREPPVAPLGEGVETDEQDLTQ
ncbi:MAG: tetratricopeptide repeat protein [Phycisphaerae bacterium]